MQHGLPPWIRPSASTPTTSPAISSRWKEKTPSQSDAGAESSSSPMNPARPTFSQDGEILEESGYLHYEVSISPAPGRESRHNRKYWSHVPYLGLGPAAHSFSGRERRWNRSSVDAYIGDLDSGREPVESREILSNEQLRLEALFLGFRTRRESAWRRSRSVTAGIFSRTNGI